LAILKGLKGDYFELNPIFLSKILFNQSEKAEKRLDITEKYTYEVNAHTGNYKWFDNEFNLDVNSNTEKLKMYIEYIPLVLSVIRLKDFFKSENKTILIPLSTEIESSTQDIINFNSLSYTLSESTDSFMIYIKKRRKYYEHHIIFSTFDYQNYFDIALLTTSENIINFYKELLSETNKFRLDILPNVIGRFGSEDLGMMEKIKLIPYSEIAGMHDKFFSIHNYTEKELFFFEDAYDQFVDHLNYIYYVKTHANDENSEEEYDPDEVQIDFLIEDMKDIEQSEEFGNFFDDDDDDEDNFYEDENNINSDEENYSGMFDRKMNKNNPNVRDMLLSSFEDVFFEELDKLMFSEEIKNDEFEKKIVLKQLKDEVENFFGLFEEKEDYREEMEKKFLLDIINSYGIDKIRLFSGDIQYIFEKINLSDEIEKTYEISEDKKLNDYKEWVKNLILKKGKNIKNIIKN